MKKYSYIILFLALFASLNGISQNSKVIGITSGYQNLDSINIQGDSLYDLSVTIHLIDSVNISKVKIEIGNSFGGSNVHNGEFNWYDSTLSSPSTIVYDRNYNMITFKIKSVVPSLLFYKASTFNFQSVSDTPYIRQQ